MIALLLSFIIVYPEDGEEIEDFFIVLSEVHDTAVPSILLDGRLVLGKLHRGEMSIVVIPEFKIQPGIHHLQVIIARDTLSSFFRMTGENRRQMHISAGFFTRSSSLTGLQSGFFTGISFNERNIGGSVRLEFDYFRDTFHLLYPYSLYLNAGMLHLRAGYHYPLNNSFFTRGTRIAGLSVKLPFFEAYWGKSPETIYPSPEKEYFGLAFGGKTFRILGVRSQSLDSMPSDNWVLGAILHFYQLKHWFKFVSGISIYTRNADFSQISRVPPWLFHVNTTTIPLIPTTASGCAGVEVRSNHRRFTFYVFGPSYYNLSSTETYQGVWKLSYTDRITLRNLDISSGLNLYNSQGLRVNLRVGVSTFSQNVWYSLSTNSSGGTHGLGWVWRGPVRTTTTIFLSTGASRVSVNFRTPYPLSPGLRMEFSQTSPPLYGINLSIRSEKFSLTPEILYSSGWGVRTVISGKVFGTPCFLSLYLRGQMYSVYLHTSRTQDIEL